MTKYRFTSHWRVTVSEIVELDFDPDDHVSRENEARIDEILENQAPFGEYVEYIGEDIEEV